MTGSVRRYLPLVLVVLAIISVGKTTVIAAEPLHSPFDQVPEQPSSTGYEQACPLAPHLPADLSTTSYYDDAAHSHIDPARQRAYKQATDILQTAARKVEAMADRYRTTGSEAAAACAASWLEAFAQAGALGGKMAGNQSAYVQGWMLGGFSMAWLKIRTVETLPASARKSVPVWLSDLALKNQSYYADRETKMDGRNNHRYWSGFAVMAAGIAADRRDLFDWGIKSFRIGINQIQPDGTLPLELARRSRALHYHLFAAAPLVTMAELAAANGLDLYAERDEALPRLVKKAISGIEKPEDFAVKAGIPQERIPLQAGTIGWAAPFEHRFPDPALQALLGQLKSRSITYLGGLPPG
ncbi:alginate lyase family protein [Aliirhizobium smilacinae]|uniref:Poly(Beta-D-mannuronate) lyase n=1 Tax=Aliirhizobium smilacinae TaxID=1395944 RepID=A0A5C4XBF0_9HYPH|nr:alginate lyase family protein [Rhizobium smilacinae]TNM60803.1 poly(beta-D-mannuronate) lyase [Rhizobium smilacinae]